MNNDEKDINKCSHTHNDTCGCNCGEHHTHDDDCCCGEHEHNTMTIITDNDEELKCSILGTFDVEDKEYIALLPFGEEDVLLYQFILKDDDSFELLNIESDDEFEKVENTFFEIFNEDFEAEDWDNEELEFDNKDWVEEDWDGDLE